MFERQRERHGKGGTEGGTEGGRCVCVSVCVLVSVSLDVRGVLPSPSHHSLPLSQSNAPRFASHRRTARRMQPARSFYSRSDRSSSSADEGDADGGAGGAEKVGKPDPRQRAAAAITECAARRCAARRCAARRPARPAAAGWTGGMQAARMDWMNVGAGQVRSRAVGHTLRRARLLCYGCHAGCAARGACHGASIAHDAVACGSLRAA
jgi:hypothetical protein